MKPIYYVATYGNAGLEVRFFEDPLAYGRAVREAKTEHAQGGWTIDSYTCGTVET